MNFITTNSMLMTQRSLDFLWTKMAVISHNVSNAETPGYKAKYVTFEQELKSRLRLAADGVEDAGDRSRVRESILRTGIVTHEADEIARMDDNGVNVTEQELESSRAYIQYQLTSRAVSEDLSRLRAAIRG